MDRRILLLATSLAVTAGGPALAQHTGTTVDTRAAAASEAAGQPAHIDPGVRDLGVEEMHGMTVYGAEGETVGDVADVIRGSDGRLSAVVETTGWLGMTSGAIAIPLDLMRVVDGDLHLPTMTEEQVSEIQAERAADYSEVTGYGTIGEAWDARLVD